MGRIFTLFETSTLDSESIQSQTKNIQTSETLNPDSALTFTKARSMANVETVDSASTLNWLLCKVFSLNEQTSLDAATLLQKSVSVTSESVMNIVSEMTVNQAASQVILAKTYSETVTPEAIMIFTRSQTYTPMESFSLADLLEHVLARSFSQTDVFILNPTTEAQKGIGITIVDAASLVSDWIKEQSTAVFMQVFISDVVSLNSPVTLIWNAIEPGRDPNQGPSPSAYPNLNFYVVDAAGKPVSGCLVSVSGQYTDMFVGSWISGKDGYCTQRGIKEGKYSFRAEAKGVVERGNFTHSKDETVNVVVDSSGSAAGLSFQASIVKIVIAACFVLAAVFMLLSAKNRRKY
jgi:hypothetical protein